MSNDMAAASPETRVIIVGGGGSRAARELMHLAEVREALREHRAVLIDQDGAALDAATLEQGAKGEEVAVRAAGSGKSYLTLNEAMTRAFVIQAGPALNDDLPVNLQQSGPRISDRPAWVSPYGPRGAAKRKK
jgi:short subunit dehydrogenase-like uncharacterized protein